MAVSPLIGGAAVKGPAAELLDWFGFGATSAGVVAAYGGLVDILIVDTSDRDDNVPGVVVRSADTVISTAEAATRLAAVL
jgi:LPPG:FO 2-phospho-L-lactate transferase